MERAAAWLLLVISVLQFTNASEFYISTTGVDIDGCGQINSPCATLNFTLAQAADGDTIYFQEGEYINQPNVTISLDNLSFIGLGNVTFNGIGTYENNSLFYIAGAGNLSFENLQFSYFFVNSVIHSLPLFLIELVEDNGYYNFTNISYLNGKNFFIATAVSNTTSQHLGGITLSDVTIKGSTLLSVVMSYLPVQFDRVIIDNCTARNNFVSIVISPQGNIPAVSNFLNSGVINNSNGMFLSYYGPYYSVNNVGGDDIVNFTNFTYSDSTGSLSYFVGSNFVMTSCSVNNVVISANYQSFIVFFYPISINVSNNVFNECFHSSNGHLFYMANVVNDTTSVLFDSLTFSNSDKVDLNYGAANPELFDVTYSNINFYNVSDPTIFIITSSFSKVENIYFSGCSGGLLSDSIFTLQGYVPYNCTFSNITFVDSTCATPCIDLSFNLSPTDIAMNNLTFSNVQSTTWGNHLFYLYVASPDISFSVYDFAASNVSGFQDTFWYTGVNFTVGGSFVYDNVVTNGTVTPLFNCGFTSTTLSVNTSLGLPLSDLFYSNTICTANYMGFSFVSNNSTYLGAYDPPSNFPFSWVIACGCVSVVAVVFAACFIIYRRTTRTYIALN